jgi:L-alanine-DL-glutamate epimerase-like enolase superfamily enzyme
VKIASVTARVIAARPEKGVMFAIGLYDVFTLVLVEVRTEDGLVGHGEAIARRGTEMTKAAVEHLLAPVLVGKDARNIEGLWQDMHNRLRRWGHAYGVVIEAISGVDCALWDIAGKAAGQPVYRLLHGAGRSEVPVYASSVYIDDYDVMVAETVEQVRQGFSTVKLKIGRTEAEGGMVADIESVGRIRDAVGKQVQLTVDANGAYDASTAIRIGRALEEFDVKWFEEPVAPDDIEGYRRIHAMTSTPLAAGESHFGVIGFRPFINEGLLDYVQPDLGRCGGITAAMQIYALTFAMNRAFAPHTGFSGGLSQLAAIHVAAAATHLDALEYMFIDNPARELFVGGYPTPLNGMLPVPDAPGLGLELDWELIDRFTVA